MALADLRIDIEDRLGFEKFMRNSISYAVSNRFNTVYSMDMENLKNNFSRINTISLEQIGLVISMVSEDIIDRTIEKSKEMDRARLLTERAADDYNRDIENIKEDRGGQNDLYRRDDGSRSRDMLVFTDGTDRGNSNDDRSENLGYNEHDTNFIINRNSDAQKILRKIMKYKGRNEIEKNMFSFDNDFFI